MADENGVEIDEPVAGILEAITDEPDKSLQGLDKEGETPTEVDSDGAIDTEIDTEVDPDEQPATAAKLAPTLPNAHRRSLKAYGWDDAEIDQNLAALGPAFMATAARIHKNRNDEVRGYADAGRQARQQQNQPQQARVEETPSLKPIDIAALKAKYGEADLIDQMAVPYNQLLQEFTKILPVIQQTQQRAQQAELETVSRQLDSYFEAQDKDLYGAAKKTEKQIENRNAVLEVADAIMYGMKKQGRDVTLNDALDMALDSVSGDSKESKARAKIKGSLQARNKGISLKPSGKSDVALNRGKVKSRDDLEDKVGRKLAALFPQT